MATKAEKIAEIEASVFKVLRVAALSADPNIPELTQYDVYVMAKFTGQVYTVNLSVYKEGTVDEEAYVPSMDLDTTWTDRVQAKIDQVIANQAKFKAAVITESDNEHLFSIVRAFVHDGVDTVEETMYIAWDESGDLEFSLYKPL